jgi:hypothetical protein
LHPSSGVRCPGCRTNRRHEEEPNAMRKSLGTVILILTLGVLIGAIVSEVIGLFLNEGSVAEQLFVRYISFGPEVTHWNLVIIELTFGFQIHFNLMSVIGVFVASQMLRWYR